MRFFDVVCSQLTGARDFAAGEEIVSKSPNEQIFFVGALVPRQIITLWLELIQGNHPTLEQFGGAREPLDRKVKADPTDPFLITALALADLALGCTDESVQEGLRAVEMRPISEDAVDGAVIATRAALVYVWTNQLDIAFERLNALAQIPNYRLIYGDLKINPDWDPLRKDPRFDRLLAELAPKD